MEARTSKSQSDVPSPQYREEVLFAAALDKPPAERAAFLDGACYGDPALRQRLETLLAFNGLRRLRGRFDSLV
jgi:hypothetical protein